MSSGSRTSERKRKINVEVEAPKSTKKWSEEDVGKCLSCIMENGHKDFEKLKKCFPKRSLEVIKMFLRTAYDIAIRLEAGIPNIDAWLQNCKVGNKTAPWKDSMQIAKVLKYLSVDGLIENHPLPSQSEGINFPEAYRLMYQAVMGYPMQPVNQETSDFVFSSFIELAKEIKNEIIYIKNVSEFLKRKASTLSNNERIKKSAKKKLKPVKREAIASSDVKSEKPVRVYQKKPKLLNETGPPSVKIVVEANENKSNCSGTKDYSVTIGGNTNGSIPTVLNIPVPIKMDSLVELDKNEKELLQNVTYNPFEIPQEWLKTPFYANLVEKTFNS